MHIPQSVIEPFGVLGFPTRNTSNNEKLVMRIKHGVSVMVYRAIQDGYAEKDKDNKRFISEYDFIKMLENMAKIDGASDAKAVVYGLWKNHQRVGFGFGIRFRVPNDSAWHTLTMRREWE